MSVIVNGTTVKKIIYNGVDLKECYCDGVLVFKAGEDVTYVVNGSRYVETVAEGDSVLNPTSFVPSKPGWTFRGWSLSSSYYYSPTIEYNLKMGTSPMTLYAVFSQRDYVPDQSLSMSYDGSASGCNLNPGGSWTATAQIDNADINNGSTGFVYLTISVGGGSRSWTSDAIADGDDGAGHTTYRYVQTENSGTAGYGGRSFSISGSGNITGSVNYTGHYSYSGGSVHVSNVVRKGYDRTIYSVG